MTAPGCGALLRLPPCVSAIFGAAGDEAERRPLGLPGAADPLASCCDGDNARLPNACNAHVR